MDNKVLEKDSNFELDNLTKELINKVENEISDAEEQVPMNESYTMTVDLTDIQKDTIRSFGVFAFIFAFLTIITGISYIVGKDTIYVGNSSIMITVIIAVAAWSFSKAFKIFMTNKSIKKNILEEINNLTFNNSANTTPSQFIKVCKRIRVGESAEQRFTTPLSSDEKANGTKTERFFIETYPIEEELDEDKLFSMPNSNSYPFILKTRKEASINVKEEEK